MELRGVLGPEPLQYYQQARIIDLSYSEITKDPFPTPEEAEVCFALGLGAQYAFVPLRIVNESEKTVRAVLVGEQGGMIMVSFPPTNFGQTSFFASEEDLVAIASEPRLRETQDAAY